jgi:hypothetical protein
MKKDNPLRSVWRLYYDGFRSMTVGRTLWLIILLKLFFLFAILRLFFLGVENGGGIWGSRNGLSE